MRWIPFPFIRITIFFIAGILLGDYFPYTFYDGLLVGVMATFMVLYLLTLLVPYARRKIIQGSIAFLMVMMCGYIHTVLHTAALHPDHIVHDGDQIQFYTAHLTKACEERDRHWRTEASIEFVKINGVWKKRRGNIQLYFLKTDFVAPFKYGDGLLIKGNPKAVEPPLNPGVFDYKQFLQYRNIYHQQFLRADDVQPTMEKSGFKILAWSFDARAWYSALIKKYVDGEREQGIAMALVFGINEGLDNDLLSAYASSGTLHVLSVSGLHVGIVYLLLMFILKPLNRFKTGKWMAAVIAVLILWAYAFVTGLSPSVLRAVAMFSFVALATPHGRRTNIYNTLSVSAFCLLLYDPFLIMSVGFQLSYLAVIGIVYLQPPLYKCWAPTSKFLDEVWKVTSVSIAAQVATFSLGLLYFHQFPNYFLVSNLLVIPLSFVVLVSGLALLVFSFSNTLAVGIGFVLTWSIKIMNGIVFYIERLPWSRLDEVYITTFQSLLLSAILIATILLLKYKRKIYLYAGVVIGIVFSFTQWMVFYEKFNTKTITVYNIPHHFAIDFFDSGVACFVADSSLYNEASKIKFHVEPNRIVHRIHRVLEGAEVLVTRKFKGGELMVWNNKYLVHLTDKDFQLPTLPPIHYVLIGNNALMDIVTLPKSLSFEKLIIDSSNSFYFADNTLKRARALGVDVHSVLHNGAFIDTY